MGKLTNIWGDCQEYKGIKLHPFTMIDYELFEELISTLLFKKNKIPDIEIIKMSYLKFILCVLPYLKDETSEIIFKDISEKLIQLLSYVFKTNDISFISDKNNKIYIYIKILDKCFSINEKEFDDIKKIILNQNAIPTTDNLLHPDVEKELEEAMDYMARRQQQDDGNIEDLITSYKSEMHFEDYNPIKNMTIYQFRKELKRLNLIKEYQIYKTAECSGMVTFKEKIPHWMSHIKNEVDYSGVMMKKSDFDAKMDSINK
jgi:hypothetical protein